MLPKTECPLHKKDPAKGARLTQLNLDPSEWKNFRRQAHAMLDDIVDYIETIRERPVWQPIPAAVRTRFRGDLPALPTDLATVHDEFMRDILPFAAGNVHPGFMGWAHGGGTRSACWPRC